MKEINVRNILNTYKMFSKRQSEILGNLAKKKEVYSFADLQRELLYDVEARKLLQKIRLIVSGEYKKAGISKPESTKNNDIKEIELYM
ncbi:hypothetical protein [uncultured Clostridium sp.]|uniref:hypothetical protein n=1 Tax=uncultured Clostridium sp. TaxID=59620 RepID=UPI0028E8B1B2|nr:hypothetical protein [uncultured Clostridium sp.]